MAENGVTVDVDADSNHDLAGLGGLPPARRHFLISLPNRDQCSPFRNVRARLTQFAEVTVDEGCCGLGHVNDGLFRGERVVRLTEDPQAKRHGKEAPQTSRDNS